MSFIIFLFAGLTGGILGGMGMGGGTVLIPVLTLLCGVGQHVSQAVNLIAFLPMAVFALAVHAKNGLIERKNIWWIVLPATASGVALGFVAKSVSGEVLQSAFGGFLVILSFVQFVLALKMLKSQK